MLSIGTFPEFLFIVLVALPAGVLRATYRNAANIGRQDSPHEAQISLIIAASLCAAWIVPSWALMAKAFAGTSDEQTRFQQAIVIGTSFFLLVICPVVVGMLLGHLARWQYDRLCKIGLISSRTVPLFEYLTSKHSNEPLFVRFRQKNARDEHDSVFIGSVVRADDSCVIVEQIREYEEGGWSKECLPECIAIVWTNGHVMWFETQPVDVPDPEPQ